ncbi:GGDEF domain-containing protein [Herbaspirillum sp. GCM10030257]|uniref:GGDEF domain-containing protein n=1 Tax=Herbaspirillum sp. GCM10030257 TaxID=3273393 RepID=UPI00361ED362
MQDAFKRTESQSPAEIAREALRRLAVQRIAPTPDAYRDMYDEIAGTQNESSPEKVLAEFAARLKKAPREIALLSDQFTRALETRNWQEYGKQLTQLTDRHLIQHHAGKPDAPTIGIETIAADTATRTASVNASMSLVDDLPLLPSKPAVLPLVDPLPVPLNQLTDILPAEAPSPTSGSVHTRLMREMLIRTWTLAVTSLLHGAPDLAKESEALAEEVRLSRNEKDLTELNARLKQLCFRIELKSGDLAEEHELLLRLFRLLFENVGELLEDDSWLSGQIARVQALLDGPVNHATLLDATRNLKDVIYKQGMLKHSLKEAKSTLKNMMLTFIDRIGAVATSTGNFHEKIGNYSQQIGKAKDILDLNKILDQIMQDTREAQTEALRSRDEMELARHEVQAADARIHELEAKLEEMSELAREDQLTGSLNRRGLDDVLEREMARSNRKKSPLCVALLDLDDFKRLNDTHGHSAGDGALIHLVQVVKKTLRTMDVIARFGGEEFLIVLPDTPLEDAMQTVTRVQRELTKQIFMHNNERLLITFSAGVALHSKGENQDSIIGRADEALYQAKRAGKNRVIAAKPAMQENS